MRSLATAFACLALAVVAYAAAAAATHDFQAWTSEDARRLDVALHPVAAPAFAIEVAGQPRTTLSALLARDGEPTIVDFMYTRCVTVCSALGSTFQRLQRELDRDGRVQLLSITFDPSYDSERVLADYATRLAADPARWRFARAIDRDDARRLLDRYRVTVIADGQGGLEHNAALLVVDGDGRLVRVFDYADADLALAYARSLRRAPRGAS